MYFERQAVDTPMDPNVKLLSNQGEPLSDFGRHKRLVVTLQSLVWTFRLQLV